MRTIIAGSRTITKMSTLIDALSYFPEDITTVICGTALGVDTLGNEWAKKYKIPIEYYPAEWDRYGKSAGYIRNQRMAENAEALLLVWDGESKGSKHMLDIAKQHNLLISVYKTKK